MSYQFEASGRLKEMTDEELAEADKGPPVIVRYTGMLDDGTPYWAYIAVKPSKYKEFMAAVRGDAPLMLIDYGEVLECGFGDTIPEDVTAKMRRDYGFDENCMEKLKKEIREAQLEFLKDQEDRRIAGIVAMLKHKK